MTKYAIGLAIALALTLTLTTAGTARFKAEDKETVAAQKDILDLAKAVADKKDAKTIEGKVTAIKGKYEELLPLMKVYKLKDKGGLGFGAKPEPKSGVEAKIMALQRTDRGPSAAVLKKEAADIIKLAHVNIAMAEIAKPYFTKPAEGKGKKDWDKWLDEQKKASEELIKAVKASDSKAVAKAAKDLLASCVDCHSVFRK